MKYLLMTYGDESAAANIPQEAMQEVMAEYLAYTQDIQKSGVRLSGEALQPTATATTVRVRDGEKVTTHGPFAETKEQLGGYYLIECENLDEAIEWAAKCPAAKFGSVEVRPIMEFEQNW
ncbi:MAG: YciI family protein [Chloroflexota bacterium]